MRGCIFDDGYAIRAKLNFERSKVWELVPRPEGYQTIGTKWIVKNKTDEDNNVIIRNKAEISSIKATDKKKVLTSKNILLL